MSETVPNEDESSERVPVADVWPSRADDAEAAAVEIKIYIVTGRHGIFTVPESFCRECNLFVRSADLAAERADVDVNVRVVSWWTHVLSALRHGGYHPPVMVVGGTRLCQGHHVPSTDEVAAAIERAADR